MKIGLLLVAGTGLMVGLALLWAVTDAMCDYPRDRNAELVMAFAGAVLIANAGALMYLLQKGAA